MQTKKLRNADLSDNGFHEQRILFVSGAMLVMTFLVNISVRHVLQIAARAKKSEKKQLQQTDAVKFCQILSLTLHNNA